MTTRGICCVPLCTNNFRNSPSLAFNTISKARRIQLRLFSFRLFWLHGKEAISAAVSRCILLVFLGVRSPQAHLLPSASHFGFFFVCFSSTFRFVLLSCFNPAETSRFAFRHVCLHSRPLKKSHKFPRA